MTTTTPQPVPLPLPTRLMARYRRVLGEGTWVLFGQAATVVGTVLGTRLLTGRIPPSVWGAVSLLIGITMFVKNVTVMPLAHAGTRYYADLVLVDGIELLRRVLRRNLMWSWLAVAVGLAAGTVAAVEGHTSIWVVLLIAILFVIDTVRTMEVTYLGAARRQRALSLWNAGEACARPAAAILSVLLLGPTASAVLTGYALASGVLLALYARRTRRSGTTGPVNSPDDPAGPWTADTLSAAVAHYAAPMIPVAVVLWINAISDRYIISLLRGPDDVGVYTGAYGLVSFPFLMAQAVLTQTLRPIYLHALAVDNQPNARRTYGIWLAASVAVAGLGFLAVLATRHWIALILLAPAYRAGGEPLLPWIAGGYAIYSTGQAVACYLQAHDRTRSWLVGETAGALASLPLTFYLVHREGVLGAAKACPMYCAVILVVHTVLVLTGGSRRTSHNRPTPPEPPSDPCPPADKMPAAAPD